MKIGLWELIVVFVVALLVIGPDRLPRYAQMLGKALREFRNATRDMTNELKENVVEPLEKAQQPLREAMEPLEEMDREIRSSVSDVDRSFKDLGKIKKKPDTENKGFKEAVPAEKESSAAPSEDMCADDEMRLTEAVTEASVSERI